MQLIVTACPAPFLGGGARYHIDGLLRELRARGHRVETVLLPFQFQPLEQIDGMMAFAEQLDLSRPNGQRVDRVISLQFPAYGVQHPDQVVWLMHQHRAAYELFEDDAATPAEHAFRRRVHDYDRRSLARASALFANSARVAERLRDALGLEAQPLYHPPPLAEAYRGADALPYLFYPSRMESLKRQDLVIEAMAHVKAPVHLLLAGDGGQAARFRELAQQRGVMDRVRFLGEISEAEKIAFYAHSLAVCYPPRDEDYGYVTLEAMLSSKAVVTCTDSGGPLAFVEDGVNGRVVEPEAGALASAIDALAGDPGGTARMGRNGRAGYEALGISWDTVIARLLD